MRSTQEENAIRGHKDGSQVLNLLVRDVTTVDERALDHKAPEGMADEDDRTVRAFSKISVRGKARGQRLCMVMDMVSRRAISESRYLRVVAISEDANMFKDLRK